MTGYAKYVDQAAAADLAAVEALARHRVHAAVLAAVCVRGLDLDAGTLLALTGHRSPAVRDAAAVLCYRRGLGAALYHYRKANRP